MEDVKYKYGVFYTDGGWREADGTSGGGLGIHGYMFNEITSPRVKKLPAVITPEGYAPKLSGAQLKDDKYNPTYTAWEYSVNVKDGKLTDEQDIKMVDIRKGNNNESAQRCELTAFIDIFTHPELKCSKYTIHSDSAYLVDGVSRDLPNWKKRNWVKSNGQPVANQELWAKINDIVVARGEDIDLRKIKAHAGHHGNEFADRNATHGVAMALNGIHTTETKLTPITDTAYWEPERNIPVMLKQPWCYSMTNAERNVVEYDGKDYTQYFLGSHSDSKDNIELLGMEMSSAGFSVVLSKEAFEPIDEIKKHHVERMWPNKNIMHQSDHMIMTNLRNVDSAVASWELTNVGLSGAVLTEGLNDLVLLAPDKLLLSKVLRPARLSFRALEVEETLLLALKSYASHHGKSFNDAIVKSPLDARFTDVTDRFYVTETGKKVKTKLSSEYDMMTKSIDFMVNNPCSSKPCKVILSVGIDLPARTIMAGLADANPKVTIVTWMFDTIMCYYGIIIESDEGLGIWSAYSSSRILSKDEQDDPI